MWGDAAGGREGDCRLTLHGLSLHLQEAVGEEWRGMGRERGKGRPQAEIAWSGVYACRMQAPWGLVQEVH